MISNMFISAESTTTTWIFVALLVVLVVVLLVVPMFTNKKRAKQTTELHNSLRPGDVIKTVGGIIGTIKEVREVSPADKEMVIETGDGDNKTTMVFDIQALYQIVSRAAEPVAPAVEPATPSVAETEDKPAETVVADEKPVDTVAEKENASAEATANTETAEEVKSEKADEVVSATEQAAVAEEATADAEVKKAETATVKKTAAPKKKPINSKNSTKK